MKKSFLIVFASLLCVGIGLFFFLKHRKLDDFQPGLKQHLQKLVRQASQGLYTIEADKVNIDIINSRVILSNVTIKHDSLVYQQLLKEKKAPADLFKLHLTSLAIDGLLPEDVVKKKDISLNTVILEKPFLHIYHHSGSGIRSDKDTVSFYKAIKNEIGSLELKKLILKDVDFTYHRVSNKVQTSFKDLHVELDSILVSEDSANDTTRFLFAKKADILLKNFKHKTADSLYVLSLNKINISAVNNNVSIESLNLSPRLSKARLRQVLKVRKDRFDLKFADIQFNEVDWWKVLSNEGLFAKTAYIRSGSIEVYSDHELPADKQSKIGNSPHQQLFKLNFPLYIQTMRLSNVDITYSEYNPKSAKEGKLYFKKTSGAINNITNIPDKVRQNAHLKIDASTQFMGSGYMKAGFDFNLARQKEGIFTAYAHLGKMDGTVLNPATKPLAMVEVKKADVVRYDVTIYGDNQFGRGRIRLAYNDLEVKVLKKTSRGDFKKRGLLSFFANNFKLNDHYPKDGKPQTINTFHQRPAHKSFFSLIWKTMLPGIKESAGI